MSDFLNQFSSDTYKIDTYSQKKEPAAEVQGEGMIAANANQELRNIDNNAIISEPAKRNSKIKAIEHTVEKDKSYLKNKIIRYFVLSGTIIAVITIICVFIFILNRITVKNLVGTNIKDAEIWGLSNKISLETDKQYTLEYEDGIIFEQNVEPDSKIQKGSVILLKVSKGPDPDEKIELPDFKTLNTAKIHEWKQQYKVLNANIIEEYSGTVEKGKFLRIDFTNSAVNENNYSRKDGLLIYVSKGDEIFENNITVPNFYKKAKTEAESWAKENNIEAAYKTTDSDNVPEDSIISQDLKAGTKIAKKSKITLTVSLGKAVIVPDFSTMTKEEAEQYTDLTLKVKSVYSDNFGYGYLISQSQPAGKKLIGEDQKAEVVYSEGLPYIDDLTGKTEKDLQSYFYELKSKGANIRYGIVYVDGAEPKGTTVWSSYSSEFVYTNTYIEIHISRGNVVREEPDVSDLSVNSTNEKQDNALVGNEDE